MGWHAGRLGIPVLRRTLAVNFDLCATSLASTTRFAGQLTGNREWHLRPGIPSHPACTGSVGMQGNPDFLSNSKKFAGMTRTPGALASPSAWRQLPVGFLISGGQSTSLREWSDPPSYRTSLAKSASRERSPRARVICPPCGQPLNLSTAKVRPDEPSVR